MKGQNGAKEFRIDEGFRIDERLQEYFLQRANTLQAHEQRKGDREESGEPTPAPRRSSRVKKALQNSPAKDCGCSNILAKQTKANTKRNREYRCRLNKVEVHTERARPPSPTPTALSQKARTAREDRERIQRESQLQLGAGDDCPFVLTELDRRQVHWPSLELETVIKTDKIAQNLPNSRPCLKTRAAIAYDETSQARVDSEGEILVQKFVYLGS
jgi:hypothetical protein